MEKSPLIQTETFKTFIWSLNVEIKLTYCLICLLITLLALANFVVGNLLFKYQQFPHFFIINIKTKQFLSPY